MANSVLAPSWTKVRAVFVNRPTGGMDLPGRAETKRTVVTPGDGHRTWNMSGDSSESFKSTKGSPHGKHVFR